MSNKPLQIVREDEYPKYIIVSKEYCEKVIKKLCIIYSSSKIFSDAYNEDEGYYKFKYNDVFSILTNLSMKHSFTQESTDSEHKRNNIVNTYLNSLPFYNKHKEVLNKCKNLKSQSENIYQFLDYLFSDEKVMMETFELLSEFIQVDFDFYYMVDLIVAKDDILKNLRYIYDEETVSVFEEQYDFAIEKFDVNALKDLLESTQGLILKHWEEYLTKPDDYKPGEPFHFLCHSLTEIFEGDFHSNIISMSLLTENLLEVFNEEYGFIFDSTNIIAADSQDMFVNNFADSDENILYYSTIMKISVPERLVEECLELKEDKKVSYSEVCRRGFNPKAIFCLTDGSKSLDGNYNGAFELHKKFPDLKVIEIDKTLYITEGQRLNNLKIILVCNLKQKINDIENYIDSIFDPDEISFLVTIGAYDGFWADYMELKKRSSYNENDIISLFIKYEKIIKGYYDINSMFEKLSKEDLNIFLKYNPNTGIWTVLHGNPKDYFNGIIKFELNDLEIIYNNLKQYAGDERLNDIIPGLAEFLQLYGSVSFGDLCDNAKIRICSCDNFIDINHILLSYLRKEDLERIGYEKYSRTLDNLEYLEELNASLPMIMELEELINSKARDIMEYFAAELFIEKNEEWYPYYYHWKNDFKKICQCNQEMEAIVAKKTSIQESNVAIAKEIEELRAQPGDNLMKIRKLNKKRLINGVKYDKLLKDEEHCKLHKAQFEKDFNIFKHSFKAESGFDYDEFDSSYTHAQNVINKVDIGVINDEKDKLDGQFIEILDMFGLTIGQFHDYVEKYYSNEPTGPKM